MREILFRGNRRDNCDWIVGQLLRYEDGRARIIESQTDIFCYEKDNSIIQTVAHEVYPITVGQFTGLTDKNGKKIFEGDIVKEKDVVYNGEIQIKGHSYEVSMRNGVWCVLTKDDWDFLNSYTKLCEIVGNIHDNPELLEG